MKKYTVEYVEYGMFSDVKSIVITADNKQDAYARFLTMYPTVYAGWIANSIDQKGGVHTFNTFAGKPI